MSKPVIHLTREHQISPKCLHQQSNKATKQELVQLNLVISALF
jgi:hypothetical protein